MLTMLLPHPLAGCPWRLGRASPPTRPLRDPVPRWLQPLAQRLRTGSRAGHRQQSQVVAGRPISALAELRNTGTAV